MGSPDTGENRRNFVSISDHDFSIVSTARIQKNEKKEREKIGVIGICVACHTPICGNSETPSLLLKFFTAFHVEPLLVLRLSNMSRFPDV